MENLHHSSLPMQMKIWADPWYSVSCWVVLFSLVCSWQELKRSRFCLLVFGCHQSFPKNEPLAKDWWGLEKGSWGLCFLLYLFTVKFIAFHTKKVANGDLFPQDRGHYVFSCSPAMFFKIYFEKSIFSYKILINGNGYMFVWFEDDDKAEELRRSLWV